MSPRKRLAVSFLAASGFMACSFGSEAAQRVQAPAANVAAAEHLVAITHAAVHTMADQGLLQDATILIEDGAITGLGPAVDVPPGARLIDAGGMPVTPGLINSATQLGLVEVSSSLDTVDRSDSAGLLGAAFDVQYGLNFNSTLIPIARADGLTHAVVLPTGSAETPFAGSAAAINLGEGSDLLDRARLAMVANMDAESTSKAGLSRSANWVVLRAALDQSRLFKATKSRLGEVGDQEHWLAGLDVAALAPVLKGSMPLVIRASRESDIRQAVALADEFGIKVILFNANEAWRVADLLASRQIPVVLDTSDNLPRTFDEIGSRLDNAALLDAAGVVLGMYAPRIHVSHNAGLELRQAAGLAVANGLPWDSALQALTSGAARIWGLADHAGSIQSGRKADLVVWSGDPLEVTTAPMHVFVHGREVSLDNRQKELRDRYRPGGEGDQSNPAYR